MHFLSKNKILLGAILASMLLAGIGSATYYYFSVVQDRRLRRANRERGIAMTEMFGLSHAFASVVLQQKWEVPTGAKLTSKQAFKVLYESEQLVAMSVRKTSLTKWIEHQDLLDVFGRPYQIWIQKQAGGKLTVRIASFGKNGIDDHCLGDDICIEQAY